MILSLVIIFAGSASLSTGDVSKLYGAPQEVIDEITKDMDKDGEEYKVWVRMQYSIWIVYIILCVFNVLFIWRWVRNDTRSTRKALIVTNALLAIYSLFNVIMAILGFH